MPEAFPPNLERFGAAAKTFILEAVQTAEAMAPFVEHSDPASYLRSMLRDVMLAYLDEFHLEPKAEEQAIEVLRGIIDGMVEHVADRKASPALSVVKDEDG